MAKGSIDRLNDAFEILSTISTKYPRLFTGVDATKLRNILVKTINDDPYFDTSELSNDISLGGTRIIKFDSTTELRGIKRLTLLIHRILGFHSSQQTIMYKNSIKDLNIERTLSEFNLQLSRSIRLIYDSELDWLTKTLNVDNGTLVHYYNQGHDNRLNSMDITENGWCLGVSTQWTRFKALKRNDFWQWMRTEEGASAFRFVMAAQGVRTASNINLDDRASFALKRFGIVIDNRLISEGVEANPDNMASNICNNNGGPLCRIGQSYVSGGGHAMAAANLDGVYFMDPNAGEFRFPSYLQFSSWLPKFIRKMGYHFRRHYVERMSYHPELARNESPREESPEELLRRKMQERRGGMGM